MTKPFIKWVGGKSSAITAISEFYPDNIASIKNYCDPFIGGGAMFFHLASLYKFEKIIITNGLGKDKTQIVVECLKVDYSIQKNVFEFHLGKIVEQKNILQVEDEKDILIKKLLKEKEELESKLKEKVKMVQQKIKFE